MKAHHEGLNFTWYGTQISCSAFLANIDQHKAASVTFLGQKYNLPPWSVSILPDCRNVVFNTAKVWLHYLTLHLLMNGTLSTCWQRISHHMTCIEISVMYCVLNEILIEAINNLLIF